MKRKLEYSHPAQINTGGFVYKAMQYNRTLSLSLSFNETF